MSKVAEGIYHIWKKTGVACTLVTGQESALLIDTGYGFADIRSLVENLTDLPYRILNTHCHVDHAGGNFRFDQDIMIHPFERKVYDLYQREAKPAIIRKYQKDCGEGNYPWPDTLNLEEYLEYKPCTFRMLNDGEKIFLGGRCLDVIFLPGHTRGSVVVFDEKTGILIAGDTISDSLWIQFPQSEHILKFARYLEKLKKYSIKGILSSHSRRICDPKLIDKLKEAIEHIDCNQSRVFIHPRTGVKSSLFQYPVDDLDGISKIYIVFDAKQLADG